MEGVAAWRDSVIGRIEKRGLLVTMESGEQWLHPYDGSQPFKIQPGQATIPQPIN